MTDRNRNEELYHRIQAGETSAIDRLIEANIGLVVTLADKFCGRNPAFSHLRDDLVGAGNLALVEKANYFSRPHSQIKDVMKFLTTSIGREFRKTCDSDSPFSPSHDTQKRARKAGLECQQPQRSDVPLDSLSVDDSQRRVDLRDELSACCATEAEEKIVELRGEGYSDSEISGEISIAERTIRRKRREIEQRYNEQQFALGV